MNQAIRGGQYGQNGDWYQGGQFLPNTELPKRGGKKNPLATKKQEIAPYTWQVAPNAERSLYSTIKHLVRITGAVMVIAASADTLNYYQVSRADLQSTVDRWNAGTRWL